MAIISKAARHVATHPLAFVLQTLRGFRRNQGMLLAGAIAYYALLSIVPMLILSVIVLSRFVNQAELLILLGRSLAWLVPNQADAVLADVGRFLANRVAIDLLAPCPLGCGVPVATCFATQWCGIVGYAALGLCQPFTLRDHRGTDFSARASLRRAAA